MGAWLYIARRPFFSALSLVRSLCWYKQVPSLPLISARGIGAFAFGWERVGRTHVAPKETPRIVRSTLWTVSVVMSVHTYLGSFSSQCPLYTKYFVPRVHIQTPVRHHLTCTFISSDLVKVRAFTCASSRSPVPASVAWANSLVKKQRRSMILSHVLMMSLLTSMYLGRYFKSLQAQA